MFISSMILEQPRNNPLGMNMYFTLGIQNPLIP